MSEDLTVAPERVQSLAGIHSGVTDQLTQLAGTATTAGLDFAQSHGLIANPVNNALNSVLTSREGTLQTSQNTSNAINTILEQSAKLYEQGDEEGAARLKAAADALAGSDSSGGSDSTGGSDSSGGSSSSGGSDSSGGSGSDMASQISQALGTAAQTAGQTIAGAIQGVASIPGQVMQGVQGIVQTATQAGASAGQTAGMGDPNAPGADPTDPNADRDKDGRPEGEERPSDQDRQTSPGVDRAGPSEPSTEGNRLPPEVAERRPAATRPATESL